MSQSDIQKLYGLQIDNGIWQFVNSSELKLSRASSCSIVSILDLLHIFSFKFVKSDSASK